MPDKQGFASMDSARHVELSRKGGQAKVPKGFALLTPDQRRLNAHLAALAMHAKYNLIKENGENHGNITTKN
jgi:hypothetical protein